MKTPAAVSQSYINIGVNKSKYSDLHLLMLSVLAGAFLALASVGANAAGAAFSPSAVSRVASSLVFPAGLALILFAGSELFTGNILLVIPALCGKIKISAMLRVWLIVYLGNFLGSLIVVMLIWGSGHLASGGGIYGMYVIRAAVSKNSLPFGQALCLGILCNFLVCAAVWISLAAEDLAGKMLGIYLPILLFVVSGFEHCVANMYHIPAAIIASSLPECAELIRQSGLDVSVLNWGSFLIGNMIPVTLGNVAGGAVFGAAYWFIFLRGKAD